MNPEDRTNAESGVGLGEQTEYEIRRKADVPTTRYSHEDVIKR